MTVTLRTVGAGALSAVQPFLNFITLPTTWTLYLLRSAPTVVNGLAPTKLTVEPAGTVYLPATTNGFECLFECVTTTMVLSAVLDGSSVPPSVKPTFGWCLQRWLTWVVFL